MLERAVIVCVLVTGLRCLANAQVVDPPPVIDEFDITKYLGRWYQVSTRTDHVRLATCYNANTFASLLVML